MIPCGDVPSVVFVGDVGVHQVEQVACDHQAPRLVVVGVLGVVVQESGKLLILEGDTLLNGGAVFLGDLFAEVQVAENKKIVRGGFWVQHDRLLVGVCSLCRCLGEGNGCGLPFSFAPCS